MIAVVLSLLLGAVLIGSAALKLADGPRTRLALATYGLHGEQAAIAWAAVVAVALVALPAAGDAGTRNCPPAAARSIVANPKIAVYAERGRRGRKTSRRK